MDDDKISCLLSHKCAPETHEFGEALKCKFALAGIDLLVDDFRSGDNVKTRMDSFDFDAFLFLLSPDSMASEYCQRELEAARFRNAPLFVIRMSGVIPAEFQSVSVPTIESARDPGFSKKVENLASAIRERVFVKRAIETLKSDGTMVELKEAAERLALDGDRTVIAEHVVELGKVYRSLGDATAKHWVAMALGRAGTPDALGMLRSFPDDDHPYALLGVQDAIRMADNRVI